MKTSLIVVLNIRTDSDCVFVWVCVSVSLYLWLCYTVQLWITICLSLSLSVFLVLMCFSWLIFSFNQSILYLSIFSFKSYSYGLDVLRKYTKFDLTLSLSISLFLPLVSFTHTNTYILTFSFKSDLFIFISVSKKTGDCSITFHFPD